MAELIEDFVQGAQSVTSASALARLMGNHLAAIGFDRFAFWATRSIDERARRTITNYDDVWSERYLEAGYVDIDPVIRRARKSSVPFDWTSAEPTGDRQGAFFEEARSYGICSGASYPIHCPDGNKYALTVSAGCDLTELRKRAADARHALQLIACYTQIALSAMPDPALALDGEVHLTEREREVLLWSAKGKTFWEISNIIGTSERTVKFHMRNAARKLGVYNKTHAVVKAIMSKQIEP